MCHFTLLFYIQVQSLPCSLYRITEGRANLRLKKIIKNRNFWRKRIHEADGLLLVSLRNDAAACCCVDCRDDDMQSIASMMTPDTSYDIGNMADIDNDDYNDDNNDNDSEGRGSSIVNSDSNLTITELTSHIRDTFTSHGSAHGTLSTHCCTPVVRMRGLRGLVV